MIYLNYAVSRTSAIFVPRKTCHCVIKMTSKTRVWLIIIYVCRREGSVPVGQAKTGGASIAMVHSVPELVVSEQVRRP